MQLVCPKCGEVVRAEAAIHRPTDLGWQEDNDGLLFRLRPHCGAGVLGLVSAVLMLAMGAMCTLLLGSSHLRSDAVGHVVTLLVLSLLGAGGGMIVASRGLINRAVFQLDPERFRFGYRPLYQAGGIVEPTHNIERFAVLERVVGQAGRVFMVAVYTRDGRAVPLRLSLHGADHAAFVAGRLNQALLALRTPKTYRG